MKNTFTVLMLFTTMTAFAQSKSTPKKSANDCLNCQSNTIMARLPKVPTLEESNAMQIMLAAEKLSLEDPNQVTLKTYHGLIEITDNPTNVVRVMIDGVEKFLIKAEGGKFLPMLKDGEVAIVNKEQFFYMDPKTTVSYNVSSHDSCYVNVRNIQLQKILGCAYGSISGSVARNLNGQLLHHGSSLLMKVSDENIISEQKQPGAFQGKYILWDRYDKDKLGESLSQPYVSGKLVVPQINIPSVSFNQIPVKGNGH